MLFGLPCDPKPPVEARLSNGSARTSKRQRSEPIEILSAAYRPELLALHAVTPRFVFQDDASASSSSDDQGDLHSRLYESPAPANSRFLSRKERWSMPAPITQSSVDFNLSWELGDPQVFEGAQILSGFQNLRFSEGAAHRDEGGF